MLVIKNTTNIKVTGISVLMNNQSTSQDINQNTNQSTVQKTGEPINDTINRVGKNSSIRAIVHPDTIANMASENMVLEKMANIIIDMEQGMS